MTNSHVSFVDVSIQASQHETGVNWQCPCCFNPPIDNVLATINSCIVCGHSMRSLVLEEPIESYRNLSGRNDIPIKYSTQKDLERTEALRLFLFPHARVAEIGCAEGRLGHMLKKLLPLSYWGAEPSKDAHSANQLLDYVVKDSSSLLTECGEEFFDFLYSFHVLEHIYDIAGELRRWRSLIKKTGVVIVEIPNKSGHPLVLQDKNPEHLHFFTASSLATLANRVGFDIISISTGHFESPAYPDSIRAVMRISTSSASQKDRLINSYRAVLSRPFRIFGVGGDFRCYIQPVFSELPVLGLLDNASCRQGSMIEGKIIEQYSPGKHLNDLILIASIRYEREIASELAGWGHPPSLIHTLASILSI